MLPRYLFFHPESENYFGDFGSCLPPDGSGVLDGEGFPGILHAEFDRRVVGPVGIAEHFAGEEDHVGVAVADGLFGLLGIGDHPACGGGDAGFFADAPCQGDHESGSPGDLRDVGRDEALADIEEIEAGGFQALGEFDGFLDGDSAFEPVGDRESRRQGEALGPDLADGGEGFHEEADAIFEASAVLIRALIGEGGIKFVGEIAVGEVEFQPVESGGERPFGGGDELLANVRDLLDRQGVRDLVQVSAEGDRGRGDRVPASFPGLDVIVPLPGFVCAGFASGVGDLDSGDGSVGFEEAADFREGFHVCVVVDSAVGRADASFGGDGGGFDHHESRSADGPRSEVDEMPVVGEAVLRGVLAHRRDADAVFDDDVLDLKFFEQLCHSALLLSLLAQREDRDFRSYIESDSPQMPQAAIDVEGSLRVERELSRGVSLVRHREDRGGKKRGLALSSVGMSREDPPAAIGHGRLVDAIGVVAEGDGRFGPIDGGDQSMGVEISGPEIVQPHQLAILPPVGRHSSRLAVLSFPAASSIRPPLCSYSSGVRNRDFRSLHSLRASLVPDAR
jgi:hypothetical protein